MAVVSTKYLPHKSDGSATFRESPRFVETWLVRVDSPPPTTSVMAILTAPGISFGAAHPAMATAKAMQWAYAAADQVGLAWYVTVTYYVPIIEVGENGLPLDVWGGSGANVTQPFYRDKDGNVLKNSAGDPLEGMEREWNFLGWSLTRSYSTLAAAVTAMSNINNRTNSDSWSWGNAEQWKTVVSDYRKKVIITQAGAVITAARYWEVDYKIEFKEDTWRAKPWDMGFNQRVDASGVPSGTGTNRATILGVDGKPVRQPVALANGVALSPGTPPVALDFQAYATTNYTTFFGVPS